MRITADREACVGAGQCVLSADTVFDQDEDDGRVLLLSERPDDDIAGVEQAVLLCPSQALTLTDD
ncbi:ferredoxin [Micromonospora sp. WMMD1128]|uniref:ferredoxin n=1 Tax=unclassified Micromonospora TaxID=2617518 RepID=UPI00248B1046|nr:MULTISPECIES: ferredoxin [unclassified Micromonospora]WBB71289.1 ferredoxin [Micromonospora sp. WMMD1128]WFE35241.1 ferredoxin [Micromonospora sp. WMMD975]